MGSFPPPSGFPNGAARGLVGMTLWNHLGNLAAGRRGIVLLTRYAKQPGRRAAIQMIVLAAQFYSTTVPAVTAAPVPARVTVTAVGPEANPTGAIATT